MPRTNSASLSGNNKMICKGGCSNTPKAMSNFYKSNLEEYKVYGGYCPTCKMCLSKSTVDTTAKTVTMESIKPALKKVDKPFIEEVFMVIKDRVVANDKFLGAYIKQLNCYPKYKNLVYADTIDIQIEQEKVLNAKFEEVKELEVTDEMRRFWGRGLENQDYIDMQTMFDNLTMYEENMDYKKESDYKSLCIYELQKSKIQFNVDNIKQVETLQKMIDTLSSNLGIKAVQKKDGFDNNKFVLGLIGRYHEDVIKKPIRRWVEDLGNLDLMKNITEVHYTGNMAMAMGMNHPKFEEYKKELEKYSVVFDKEGEYGED